MTESRVDDFERQVAQAREQRDLQALGALMPYARFMGFEVWDEGDSVISCMRFSEHLIGNPLLPALHGGTLGALLEHAAIMQLMWEPDVRPIPKTINVTIEYLRSTRPTDTFARATITKHGRRVANVHIIAWQDDRTRPMAAAHAHFLMRS
jgi:acyl-coenzyme A thioesterase PaaI-like protein